MSQDDGVIDFGMMTALDALRSALFRAREIHDLVNRLPLSVSKPRILGLVTEQMIGLQTAVAVLDPDTTPDQPPTPGVKP